MSRCQWESDSPAKCGNTSKPSMLTRNLYLCDRLAAFKDWAVEHVDVPCGHRCFVLLFPRTLACPGSRNRNQLDLLWGTTGRAAFIRKHASSSWKRLCSVRAYHMPSSSVVNSVLQLGGGTV